VTYPRLELGSLTKQMKPLGNAKILVDPKGSSSVPPPQTKKRRDVELKCLRGIYACTLPTNGGSHTILSTMRTSRRALITPLSLGHA